MYMTVENVYFIMRVIDMNVKKITISESVPFNTCEKDIDITGIMALISSLTATNLEFLHECKVVFSLFLATVFMQ